MLQSKGAGPSQVTPPPTPPTTRVGTPKGGEDQSWSLKTMLAKATAIIDTTKEATALPGSFPSSEPDQETAGPPPQKTGAAPSAGPSPQETDPAGPSPQETDHALSAGPPPPPPKKSQNDTEPSLQKSQTFAGGSELENKAKGSDLSADPLPAKLTPMEEIFAKLREPIALKSANQPHPNMAPVRVTNDLKNVLKGALENRRWAIEQSGDDHDRDDKVEVKDDGW